MDNYQIENLPDDILRIIFNYLQENSLKLRTVCFRWKLLVTKYKIKGYVSFPSLRYDNIIQIFTRIQFKVRIRKREDINQICLLKVHTLSLNGTQVSDVLALGGIYTLDLSTQVSDVSALGGVYTLDLSTQVSDVSALEWRPYTRSL